MSRKAASLLYLIIALVLAIAGFLYWHIVWRFKEYTNDAYVEGNQIYITPLVDGFVTAIHTDDTFLVKKGHLLVELDETDAKIALEKEKKELANVVRRISEAFHEVFALQAEIEVRKAELIKNEEDFSHRFAVLPEGGVSLEDYQHALAAVRASYFSLQKTKSLFDKAFAFVQGTSIKNHPLVVARADALRYAFVQLYRCKIYAPATGLIAQRTIQVGMWAKQGDNFMSVIPLDQLWVNANFKETQLKGMRIGQLVKLTSDLYGDDVVFHGTIVGLPGGAGNAFSLLPPENLSGNWIKIVQRLPVRVALKKKELEKHPLRIGLSMEATAFLSDQEGLLVPTSSKGSPYYHTDIFTKEELGDAELIKTIIDANLDPSLQEYADKKLELTLTLPDYTPPPEDLQPTSPFVDISPP